MNSVKAESRKLRVTARTARCLSRLAGVGLHLWRLLFMEGEEAGAASALAGLTPRLLSVAMLPLLICMTGLGRLARRLIDGA